MVRHKSLVVFVFVFAPACARQSRRRVAKEFAYELMPQAARLAAISLAAPDVHSVLPLPFLDEYANPCWRNGTALRCIPAFYIAGGLQCGVDDLWSRLIKHAHVLTGHDKSPWWWNNHPKSRTGNFDRYTGPEVISRPKVVRKLEREPAGLIGDASPAALAFIMADQLRLHYLYLDAFSKCHGRCRSASPPPELAAACRNRSYGMTHCYAEAQRGAVPIDFNLPSFLATTMGVRPPRVVLLLREPALRLFTAFHSYGQFPQKYGTGGAGLANYFGNQSAAFE